MKQQDIIIVFVIVFIAGIFSYFVSTKFVTPSDTKLTAEIVEPIDTTFSTPDPKVFNSEAINPTVKITINPNTNTQPFANQNQ